MSSFYLEADGGVLHEVSTDLAEFFRDLDKLADHSWFTPSDTRFLIRFASTGFDLPKMHRLPGGREFLGRYGVTRVISSTGTVQAE